MNALLRNRLPAVPSSECRDDVDKERQRADTGPKKLIPQRTGCQGSERSTQVVTRQIEPNGQGAIRAHDAVEIAVGNGLADEDTGREKPRANDEKRQERQLCECHADD